jgi:type II secretory pathway pseudopilin PulG
MKLSRRRSSSRPGYTLIEAVMVFLLIAIISFGIGSFIVTSIKLWAFISGRQSAVKSSQTAMSRMVGEIRRMKDNNNIIPNTVTSYTWEVQFLDFDSNTIDFRQVGGNLMRNNNILATGLVSPEGRGLHFTYVDSTGEVTTTKQNMRAIRIWLCLTAGGQTTTLESSSRIRAYEIQ